MTPIPIVEALNEELGGDSGEVQAEGNGGNDGAGCKEERDRRSETGYYSSEDDRADQIDLCLGQIIHHHRCLHGLLLNQR